MARRNAKSAAAVNHEKKVRARVRRAALAGEERARWLARHAEYQRKHRAQLPPERLAMLRQENAARNRLRRAALSPEGLERLRRENRERARRRRDCDRPDFFASVGLHRERRAASPAGDPPLASPRRRRRALRTSVSPPCHELDPSDLLSNVVVELTEVHSDAELETERTEAVSGIETHRK